MEVQNSLQPFYPSAILGSDKNMTLGQKIIRDLCEIEKCKGPVVDFDMVQMQRTGARQPNTYGRLSKPRKAEPSMQELLSWTEEKKMNDGGLGFRRTKNQDAYRRYICSPDKKQYYLDPSTNTLVEGYPMDYAPQQSQHQYTDKYENNEEDWQRQQNEYNRQMQAQQYQDQMKGQHHTQNIPQQYHYSEGEQHTGQAMQAMYNPNLIDAQHSQQQQIYDNQKQNQQYQQLQQPQDQQQHQQYQGNNTRRGDVSGKKKQDKKRPSSAQPTKKKQTNFDESPRKTQIDRIKHLNRTTRWLANSSFTTFFGKPAFHAYGTGNTKPVYGGTLYGDYMLTHNVSPHEDGNNPQYRQVYQVAELKGSKMQPRAPQPPRKIPDDIRLTPTQLEEVKSRNQLMPPLKENESRAIIKPDLYKSQYFSSAHTTPNTSLVQDKEKKNTATSKKGSMKKAVKSKFLGKSQQQTKKSMDKEKNITGDLKFKLEEEEKMQKANKQTILDDSFDRAKTMKPAMPAQEYIQPGQIMQPTQQQFYHPQAPNFYQSSVQKPQYRPSQTQNPTHQPQTQHQTQAQVQPQKLTFNSTPQKSQHQQQNLQQQQYHHYQHHPEQHYHEKYHHQHQQQQQQKTHSPHTEPKQPYNRQNYLEDDNKQFEENLYKNEETQVHENIIDDELQNYEDTRVPLPYCCMHDKTSDIPVHELDPRNYKFVPACWTGRIIAAGKKVIKSEKAGSVISGY